MPPSEIHRARSSESTPSISPSVYMPSLSDDTNASLSDGLPNPNLASSDPRFSPSFAYNARVAFALAPCAALFLYLGGLPVVRMAIPVLSIAYLTYWFGYKYGALIGVWCSLIPAGIAVFFSSYPYLWFNSFCGAALAAFLCAWTCFLIGAWASLQFKWIQIENRPIAIALERLLFACVPFAASSIFIWFAIYAFGMTDDASYYLMVLNCVFYWLFAIPRGSSFKSKQEVRYHAGEVPGENFILRPGESSFLTLNLLFLPLLVHIVSHYSVLFSSVAAISDSLLLFFIPFLLMLHASTSGALWWVTKLSLQPPSMQMVSGTIAKMVVVICLVIKAVHYFGRYEVPPPLNYLLMTTTAGAGACPLGMEFGAYITLVFTALPVIVSAAGAIVVGFPILGRFQPAICCLGLAVASRFLFIFFQPPIPLSLVYQPNQITYDHHFTIISRWEMFLTLAAATSIIPIKNNVVLRAGYSVAMGVALGIYISDMFCEQTSAFHNFIVVIVVLAFVFVVFTNFPCASSPTLLLFIYWSFVPLFFMVYFLDGMNRLQDFLLDASIDDMEKEDEYLRVRIVFGVQGVARTPLIGFFVAICMVIAVEIKLKFPTIIRERRRQGMVIAVEEALCMLTAGNIATVICFLLCLVLNGNITGESNMGIFFCLHVLLLFNQKCNVNIGFGNRQRYIPVIATTSVYLVLTALYSAWKDGNASWGTEILLMILTFPSFILYNHFIWGLTNQSNATLLLSNLSLNLLSIIQKNRAKIWMLGVLGIVHCFTQ